MANADKNSDNGSSPNNLFAAYMKYKWNPSIIIVPLAIVVIIELFTAESHFEIIKIPHVPAIPPNKNSAKFLPNSLQNIQTKPLYFPHKYTINPHNKKHINSSVPFL